MIRKSKLTYDFGSCGLAAAALGTLLLGCSSSDNRPYAVESAEDAIGTQCSQPNRDRSLVIHDAATMTAADFSLKRTLTAIIATSGGSPTTPELFLKSLLDDFAVTSATQPESGLVLPVDSRQEATLNPAILINESVPPNAKFLKPIALFNRLDLAPADASNCGEYRIVYAKTFSATGRFFMIFEAVLPNPRPEFGIAACKPVADFWASLSNVASVSERAAKLADFYYMGLPGFEPVVKHSHYGVPLGQVRTNHFLNFQKWQLREWRTGFDATLAPTFVMDTVKETPLAQFYDSAFVPPGNGEFIDTDPAAFAVERAAFQTDFLNTQMAMLAAPELSGQTLSAAKIINGIGSAFPNRFNEFQSDAEDDQDIPKITPGSNFSTAITLGAPAGLSAEHIINRAGLNTCGGCHEFSNGAAIGTANGVTVNWPMSNGFFHVSEGGTLSAALNNFFLPARGAVLTSFLCADNKCCSTDADCSDNSVFRCVGEQPSSNKKGICKPAAPQNGCWDDADCGENASCSGRIICPCGTDCARADQPGTCTSSSATASKTNSASDADVTSARDALLSDVKLRNADSARAEQLEKAVQTARNAERAQPGAFVKRRMAH